MTENSNGVIILITLLNILVYKLQQLQEAKFTQQTNQLSLSLQKLCRRFSLRDIQWATFNFHDELVIGQGGFGKVYKGILDFGATTVAIKRLKSGSKQGPKEFLTEIEMLSNFQHSHLVSLVGYCDDCHEMILIYEYMPCGTLADHLHKRARKGVTSSPPLSWEQRLKICIGAARGLDYLHTGTSVQHRVIHRDVKSSNILLDENMAAKISDFGLSKIGPSNQPFSAYISTHVKGTPGYLDPYYFATHTLTRKSDVYSLGVVLFEALCGRRAVDNSLDEEQRGLAGWVQYCFKEGHLEQIIDPSIKGKILPNSLAEFVRVAIQCLHNAPKLRPTMAEVVVGLESALALQERGTIYTLVETPITNCDQVNVNANSSMVGGNQGNLGSPMVEVENANHNQENKNCSLEEGVINDADGGHHDEQSPARMTFTEKISLFLFGTSWKFSANILGATELQGPLTYSYKDLKTATKNFSEENKLGVGGFGDVYKGILKNGNVVAVKRLEIGSSGRAHATYESEVKLISNVHHRNLIRLLGCCTKGPELLLVLEYMPNSSLDKFLYGEKRGILNWKQRFDIIFGTARGLAYLQEQFHLTIIHRNIKSSNILLDEEFQPKIADFGLARLLPEDQSHLSTKFAGTLGYTAPEYAIHGQLSEKVDTYSFGVVVLEIISGRKCNEMSQSTHDYLVEDAWKLYENNMHLNLIDGAIDPSEYRVEAVKKAIEIALMCTEPTVALRPTMSEVVVMLLSDGSVEQRIPSRNRPDLFDLDKRVPGDSSTSNGSSTTNATVTFTAFTGR